MIEKTYIEGVMLLTPKVFRDDRGFFYESWRERDSLDMGMGAFVQDNVSVGMKNVLKGFHFQKNQGQLIFLTQGKILDVVVDLRENSPTFKKYFSVELDAESPQQIYMPPGCAHGLYVLSDKAVVNYKSTQYYNPKEEGGVRWDDPEIGVEWNAENPILSERDCQFNYLKDTDLSLL